jgi:hypothetical protein
MVREVGLELVDAWAEAPAGAGPGPVATYLGELTEVEPGDASVVLPPLVTVIGRRLAPRGAESQGLASRGAEATSRCR